MIGKPYRNISQVADCIRYSMSKIGDIMGDS